MRKLTGRTREVSVSALLMLLMTIAAARGQDRPEAQPLPQFTDITQAAGISFHHRFGDEDLSNIVEGTGAGVLIFDYDRDGYQDLYFACGSWLKEVSDNRGRKFRGKLTNRLYKNLGNGTFRDVTQQAGVGDQSFSCGASAADYDDDGDLDLYVLNYGANVLYRNNGNGTFTDVSADSGLANSAWSLSAPWLDYDGDGDLDVYVVNYLQYDAGKFRAVYAAQNYPGPLSYEGQADVLYCNNGDGTFTDVTRQAGIYLPEGRGMSGTVIDLDNDGRLDVYVTNDAMENYYLRNLGGGKFVEDGQLRGLAFGEGGQGVSSMGPASGDVDRNGWIDLLIPDMGFGCLLLNRDGFFDDRTARSKIAQTCGQYTGWGGVLFDLDNDGYLDVFVANGNAHHEYSEEDVLMHNDGTAAFVDIADRSGPYFHEKHVGRGASYGDLDNDGDLDLVIVNLNDTPKLLRNDGGNRNHWLQVNVLSGPGKCPAVGARVTVKVGSLVQVHDLACTVGYLSQADPRCHFGLGRATVADEVIVRWPDGRSTSRHDVPADQVLTIADQATKSAGGAKQ